MDKEGNIINDLNNLEIDMYKYNYPGTNEHINFEFKGMQENKIVIINRWSERSYTLI